MRTAGSHAASAPAAIDASRVTTCRASSAPAEGEGGGDKIIIVWPPLAIVEVVGNDELVEGRSRKLLPALASAAHKRTACHDMIMVQAG